MLDSKIAVIGGSGFLGQYVLKELQARGFHKLINCDLNNSDDTIDIRFTECDILNPEQLKLAVKGCDYVFHFAGMAHLDTALDKPVETINLNVCGTLNVLEACIDTKVKRCIFASSAYAMNNKGSFYGISKLTSEKLIEEYEKRYGLKYTILRYGSVYSELDYENNYIYNLVKKAMLSGQIVHHGDGEEIREYIHASDVAFLTVDILQDKNYENEHIVPNWPERLRRVELFEMINEILNYQIKITLDSNESSEGHYRKTPYAFDPKISKKIVPKTLSIARYSPLY